MKRLRVGLVGAGLVGQAEHAFYLWEERERFEFVALADASTTVREALRQRYGLEDVHPDIQGLLGCGLDAVVIAAPDPFHPDLAVAALEGGLHVLCEKPLALTLAGCDRIAAARDRSGKVLQVAYMKRHDPAYQRALELLPSNVEDVKLISVEVNDPDFEPFVAHLPMTWPKDIPADLRSQARSATAAAAARIRGADLTRDRQRSAGRRLPLVAGARRRGGARHPGASRRDLPAQARARRAVRRRPRRAAGLRLCPAAAACRMTHLNLAGVPDYTERVTIYCTDRIIELTFPVAVPAPSADAPHLAARRRRITPSTRRSTA